MHEWNRTILQLKKMPGEGERIDMAALLIRFGAIERVVFIYREDKPLLIVYYSMDERVGADLIRLLVARIDPTLL